MKGRGLIRMSVSFFLAQDKPAVIEHNVTVLKVTKEYPCKVNGGEFR